MRFLAALLIFLEERFDPAMQRTTRPAADFLAWFTGRDSITLGRWLLHVGFTTILAYRAADFIDNDSPFTLVSACVDIWLWRLALSDVRSIPTEPTDILPLAVIKLRRMRAWYAMCLCLLLTREIVSVVVRPAEAAAELPYAAGWSLVVLAFYVATSGHGGGKRPVERVREVLAIIAAPLLPRLRPIPLKP